MLNYQRVMGILNQFITGGTTFWRSLSGFAWGKIEGTVWCFCHQNSIKLLGNYGFHHPKYHPKDRGLDGFDHQIAVSCLFALKKPSFNESCWIVGDN